MTYQYTIESEERLDTLQLLDAVASILEPNPHHKPSTDSLIFWGAQNVTHSRLGLSVTRVPG